MAKIIEEQKVHPITGEMGTFCLITTNDGSEVGSAWSTDTTRIRKLYERAERLDSASMPKPAREEKEEPDSGGGADIKKTIPEPEPAPESERGKGEAHSGEPLYGYVESVEPYYTIEMFIDDTGEDHEEIWKEAFIDKSTNFLEQAQPTSTETPDKSDKDLAHDLYAKAQAHGDAIAHKEAGIIKGLIAAQRAAYKATAYATIPQKIAEYVSENSISLDEAMKKVETDAEQQKEEHETKTEEEIQATTDADQAENDAVQAKEDATRESQLKESFQSGDKHCADGPDKVVSLINNTVTDFIRKTLAQEEQRAKVDRDNVDADVESKVKQQGEKAVSVKNAATMEVARNIVAMKKKLEEKVKIVADQAKQSALLKIFGMLGV